MRVIYVVFCIKNLQYTIHLTYSPQRVCTLFSADKYIFRMKTIVLSTFLRVLKLRFDLHNRFSFCLKSRQLMNGY